jgi:6,7-dimethyl-8-ribityllumazine synthase
MRNPAAAASRIAFLECCTPLSRGEIARRAFCATLRRSGLPAGRIDCIDVGDVRELPSRALIVARRTQYAIIVPFGCVDSSLASPHYLARLLTDCLAKVQVRTGVPVLTHFVIADASDDERMTERLHQQLIFAAARAGTTCARTLGLLQPLHPVRSSRVA